jgi:hypothetical protein
MKHDQGPEAAEEARLPVPPSDDQGSEQAPPAAEQAPSAGEQAPSVAEQAPSPVPPPDEQGPSEAPDPESPRFTPSEAWLEQFRAQYSKVMTQLVAGYAARRVGGIGSASAQDDGYPQELVANALADTLLGRVRWNPNTKELDEHIRDVIKRRTSIDWERAKKYPHDSIDATTRDGQTPTLDEVDRMLLDREPDPRAAENAREAVDELRQLADADPDVRAYIEARASGASRAELMRVTGLSSTRYRRVRRQLDPLLRQLSMQARPKRGK